MNLKYDVTHFKFIDPWERFIMIGLFGIDLPNRVAWFHVEKGARYLVDKKDEITLKRDLVIKIQNNGDLYIYIDRSKYKGQLFGK